MDGYKEALEAAGAVVFAYKEFGSYQGEWFALVEFNGRRGWVAGAFGSCCGCDALQAEFDYGSSDRCEEHRYDYEDASANCSDCAQAKASYATKFAAFGQSYLDTMLTQEEAEAQAQKNIDWDMDAEKMLTFLCSFA